MKLPFSVEQFLEIFKDYNTSVFPLHFMFYVLALAIIFLAIKKNAASDMIISSILAFFWLWMGIVYHILFFSTINKAAYLFGAMFILQGGLFFYLGVIKQILTFNFTQSNTRIIGAIIIAFALIGYPVVGYFFGRTYPYSPTFGVPCPTTIFTFGILLWSIGKIPYSILVIPFLWSLLGFSAATTLGIREDFSLIITSFITIGILLFQRRKLQTTAG